MHRESSAQVKVETERAEVKQWKLTPTNLRNISGLFIRWENQPNPSPPVARNLARKTGLQNWFCGPIMSCLSRVGRTYRYIHATYALNLRMTNFEYS